MGDESAVSRPSVSRSTQSRILRLEALALAVASIVAYRVAGGGWGMYAALWLIPDLAMVGYLANPRVGSIAYNTTHNLVLPALVCAVGLFGWPSALTLQLGLLWFSHVAIDRALGFGLKYPTVFMDTHLVRT